MNFTFYYVDGTCEYFSNVCVEMFDGVMVIYHQDLINGKYQRTYIPHVRILKAISEDN